MLQEKAGKCAWWKNYSPQRTLRNTEVLWV